MQTSSIRLYSLKYYDVKAVIFSVVFILGNIVFPQLCHTVHMGGPTWLPIYFFTLIGAYKYGCTVGLLTAVASPLLNSFLFGMPAAELLPVILLKSTLLALFAGIAARRFGKVTLWSLVAVVLAYQIVGSAGEWIITDSFRAALQDFIIGWPGMVLQIVGGYFFITRILNR